MDAPDRRWEQVPRAAALGALLALVLPAVAAAQAQALAPLLPPPQGASFCQTDLGQAGVVPDDGFYLVWRAPGAAGSPVRTGDLRLAPVAGRPAGSLVVDADVAERVACLGGASTAVGFGPAAGGTHLFALDVDGNGRYTAADCVVLDRDASGALSRWDLRVTSCAIGAATAAAGTLVEWGDPELPAAPAAIGFGPGAFLAYQDLDGDGALGAADDAYAARTTCAECGYPAAGDVLLRAGTLHPAPTSAPAGTAPPPSPGPGAAGPPGAEEGVNLTELQAQVAALARAFEAQQAERARLAASVEGLAQRIREQGNASREARQLLAEAQQQNAELQAERDARATVPGPGWLLLSASMAGAAVLVRRRP